MKPIALWCNAHDGQKWRICRLLIVSPLTVAFHAVACDEGFDPPRLHQTIQSTQEPPTRRPYPRPSNSRHQRQVRASTTNPSIPLSVVAQGAPINSAISPRWKNPTRPEPMHSDKTP